jgi:hypothetical protein
MKGVARKVLRIASVIDASGRLKFDRGGHESHAANHSVLRSRPSSVMG